MVIYGDQDNLINPSCSENLANYLECKVVKIEGHGHGIEATAPQVIAESMRV